MTDDPRVAAFWRQLEQAPEDWDLRLVFSDLLEDLGLDVLAAGQRWQAANEKRPQPITKKYWCKLSAWGSDLNDESYMSDIPDALYAVVASGRREIGGDSMVGFNSNRQADEALAHAVHEVTLAAQKQAAAVP